MIQVPNSTTRGNRSMFVRYWQPFQDMETLARQLDRLFDDLDGTPQEQPAWAPAMELQDTGEALVLRVQIPGVDAKDVDIQVAKQSVTISGESRQEHKAEENGYFKSEFRYGKFHRTVKLPVAVDNTQVTADYTNGILTLTLPKHVEVRNQVVKVNLTEAKSAPDVNSEAVNG
jgi:HSP20 family protein